MHQTQRTVMMDGTVLCVEFVVVVTASVSMQLSTLTVVAVSAALSDCTNPQSTWSLSRSLLEVIGCRHLWP